MFSGNSNSSRKTSGAINLGSGQSPVSRRRFNSVSHLHFCIHACACNNILPRELPVHNCCGDTAQLTRQRCSISAVVVHGLGRNIHPTNTKYYKTNHLKRLIAKNSIHTNITKQGNTKK